MFITESLVNFPLQACPLHRLSVQSFYAVLTKGGGESSKQHYAYRDTAAEQGQQGTSPLCAGSLARVLFTFLTSGDAETTEDLHLRLSPRAYEAGKNKGSNVCFLFPSVLQSLSVTSLYVFATHMFLQAPFVPSYHHLPTATPSTHEYFLVTEIYVIKATLHKSHSSLPVITRPRPHHPLCLSVPRW